MQKDLDADRRAGLCFVGAKMGGVAHNINSPLTAIMGRLDLLRNRLSKISEEAGSDAVEEEIEKCLRDLSLIGECCGKIDTVLKDSVTTAQGILSGQKSLVHLDVLLRAVLEFSNADMTFKHQISKSFEFQQAIPSISVNQSAFVISFLELLDNARGAMAASEEKRLVVTMAVAGGCIEVAFHDTGCGIAPRTREELLALLHDSGTTAEGHNSGLQRVGRLLRPYHVEFEIRSAPGDTLFSLRVPVKQDGV